MDLPKKFEEERDPYYNSVYALQTRIDIPKTYKLEQPLGIHLFNLAIGGFGVVVKAKDRRTNEQLAIKKILRVTIISKESHSQHQLKRRGF